MIQALFALARSAVARGSTRVLAGKTAQQAARAKWPAGMGSGPAAARGGAGALERLSTAGFGIQSWGQIFENWLPSCMNTVSIEAIGKKGTPSKHVLHVALAAAFGVLSRAKVKIGDCGLKVTVDHMQNAVGVSYSHKVNIVGSTAASLLEAAARLPDANLGSVFGYKLTPWTIGKFGIGPVGWVGMATGALETPQLADGGAKGSPDDRSVIPEVGNNSSAMMRALNVGSGDYLWSDPSDPLTARNFGSLARESIEAGLPPAFLFPPNGDDKKPKFPEPFASMVKPLLVGWPNGSAAKLLLSEQITTRFDKMYSSDSHEKKVDAGNPLPPTPRDKTKEWPYAKAAPPRDGITEADGYGYDLKSLVAAALLDPSIKPDPPSSHQTLEPY